MPIPRIHSDQNLGPGAQLSLAADAARHVARALRLKSGDALILFDGRGGEYEAVIQRIEHGHVDVKLGAWRDVDRESRLRVGLVQGLPEADRMDWIVQKATELGVDWIQPLACDRSVVRLAGERAERRQSHWQRVAIAACEQSGRTRVPQIRRVLPFTHWLAEPAQAPRWLLDPASAPLGAQPAAPEALELVVGPEGGLSDRERELALSHGCLGMSLGPRILRTETAPAAALAALHALWGDFRP